MGAQPKPSQKNPLFQHLTHGNLRELRRLTSRRKTSSSTLTSFTRSLPFLRMQASSQQSLRWKVSLPVERPAGLFTKLYGTPQPTRTLSTPHSAPTAVSANPPPACASASRGTPTTTATRKMHMHCKSVVWNALLERTSVKVSYRTVARRL